MKVSPAGFVVLVDYYPTRRWRRWGVRVIDTVHGDEVPDERLSFYFTEHGAVMKANRELEQTEHAVEGVKAFGT